MEEELVAVPITGEGSNSERQAQSGYTELIGGTVPCPSCQGSGFIPKGNYWCCNIFSFTAIFLELESTLVALIPLNDERLKPKRTYVFSLF